MWNLVSFSWNYNKGSHAYIRHNYHLDLVFNVFFKKLVKTLLQKLSLGYIFEDILLIETMLQNFASICHHTCLVCTTKFTKKKFKFNCRYVCCEHVLITEIMAVVFNFKRCLCPKFSSLIVYQRHQSN